MKPASAMRGPVTHEGRTAPMAEKTHVWLGIGLAGAIALSACQTLPLSRVATGTAGRPVPKSAANQAKTSVGQDRQGAFVASLRDALPVSMASGGLGTLALASSLVSNNGGSLLSDNGLGLISNNGGSIVSNSGAGLGAGASGLWGLLQAPMSLLPAYTRVRQDVVMVQKPTGMLAAEISLYDPKTWNAAPGADNEAALIDRFAMTVLTFKVLTPEHGTFDLGLKVVTSRRLPFADKLVLRQEVKKDATGKFQSVKMAYLLDFDAVQADGTTDRAEFELVAGAEDLAPDAATGEVGVSYEPRRMDMTGKNGRGAYTGEWKFPPGGAIEGRFTHTVPGGAETLGEFTIQPDGASTQVTTSQNGRLALVTKRTAAGVTSLELRDVAGPTPVVLPDAVSEAKGVATFELGEGGKVRARLF